MHIAISTASLSDNTPDALKRAAALGFQHVEITLQPHEFGYGYQRKPNVRFYRALREQLDALKLSVWSYTSVPLSQEQMFYERAHKDMLMAAAAAGGLLNAKVFIVKPADIFTSEIAFEQYINSPNSAPPTVEGYDETWVQTVNRQMVLALPNYNHWLGIHLTNQAERLQKVTFDLGIGWAMDVRRASQRGTIAEWLQAASARLAVAHAYDWQADEATLAAPLAPEWGDWLSQLKQTHLKCVVLHAHPTQSDTQLQASRDYFRQLLAA